MRGIDTYSYPSFYFSNRLRAFNSLDLNIHFFCSLYLKNEIFIKPFKKDDFLSKRESSFLSFTKRTFVPSCEKEHFFHIKFPNLYLGTFFRGKIEKIEVILWKKRSFLK